MEAKYITIQDIYDVFGEENIASWSSTNNYVPTTDTERVDRAILEAEGMVEGMFANTGYYVPFEPVDGESELPNVLITHIATIAGSNLYRALKLLNTEDDVSPVLSKRRESEVELRLYINQYGNHRYTLPIRKRPVGFNSFLCRIKAEREYDESIQTTYITLR